MINSHRNRGAIDCASFEVDIALGFVHALPDLESVATHPSEVVEGHNIVDWLVLAWVVGGDADALRLRLRAEGVIRDDADRVLDNDGERNGDTY